MKRQEIAGRGDLVPPHPTWSLTGFSYNAAMSAWHMTSRRRWPVYDQSGYKDEVECSVQTGPCPKAVSADCGLADLTYSPILPITGCGRRPLSLPSDGLALGPYISARASNKCHVIRTTERELLKLQARSREIGVSPARCPVPPTAAGRGRSRYRPKTAGQGRTANLARRGDGCSRPARRPARRRVAHHQLCAFKCTRAASATRRS